MKRIIKVFTVLSALIMVLPMVVGAYYSYQTYTYDIDGNMMESPDAYVPSEVVDSASIGLATPMESPSDITVDNDGNVYVADGGNNRIIVMNNRLKLRFYIDEFVNEHGVNDALLNPQGVFVTDDLIYVCDTDNGRVVVFDKEGEYLYIVPEPVSDEITADDLYKPKAMAVDASGRMYIVSSTTPQGIIQIDADGTFRGFIGAQATTLSAWDIFWRKFQTEEQLESSDVVVATEYENITIDSIGMIYVTTTTIDEGSVMGAINGKSKDGTYMPVKKLNTQGDEIMSRNGFYPPAGEICFNSMGRSSNSSTASGPSALVDVALGPEGTWSIIDEKRQKVYTYDDQGKLLFVFGDSGDYFGNMKKVTALTYMGNEILVLDSTADNITVFKRTEYGDILISALKNQNDQKYDEAANDWQRILMRNNNFDEAYVGIGKSYYRDKDYVAAMEMYESAYDTSNYSTAFKQYRKEWVAKYALVVPVVVVVIVIALVYFFKFIGKRNKEVATRPGGKRTYFEEVIYAFHLMMHPFDGFWDLKHEKRGSVRGAITWLMIAVAAFTYNAIGTSYLFNPYGGYTNVFGQVLSIAVPLLLWTVANWCLTTLFEGEGSLKDIFIASCYALVPVPLCMIPATLLTHIFSLDEAQIVSMISVIMFAWVGMLIFFGSQVTHDFSLTKNLIMSASTIIGMAFIMFVGLLFSSLVQKIVGFVSSIITELSYRI